MLDRRNQNRLPPAIQAARKGLPALVIVVTTTLFVSPEAWAKVTEGKARAMVISAEQPEPVQDDGKIFIKKYKKEELNKQVPPNPVQGFDARIARELNGVINRVGSNLSESGPYGKIKRHQTVNPSEDQWRFHVAAMVDAPEERKANIEGVRTLIAAESQRAATQTVKSKLDFIGKLGSGFKFTLDLKSWFGGKSDKVITAETAKPKAGTLRYGLILEEIVPDPKAPKRAAVGNTMADELEYAGHAEVRWTIGPVEESSDRQVFAPVGVGGLDGQAVTGEGMKIPSPNLNATVTPENFENFAKVDQENMPAWRVDLSQEDGLYAMTYRSSTKGERLSVDHMFKVPVAGTIELGRRFTDNFDVVQTSVYNILYDKRLPLLSVHYMDVQKRVMADLTKNVGKHSFSITARGEAKNTEGVKKNEIAENYTIGYGNEF